MIPTNPSLIVRIFGIILNSNNFVFRLRAFAVVSSFYSLIKATCERHSICRRSKRRDRICATVHSANAEIQLGDALSRFDGADNIVLRTGGHPKMHHETAEKLRNPHVPAIRKSGATSTP
jgi:hypothetical protein